MFEGSNLPTFDLQLTWLGNEGLWAEITALVGVWGHLGGLGFRQRRAMGALAFGENAPALTACLERFSQAGELTIKSLPAGDPDSAVRALASWLKEWRSHGRSVDHPHAHPPNPPHNRGFDPYARNDHNRGADCLHQHGQLTDRTFRPALGLPIIQRFQSGGTVNWEYDWERERRTPKGRFASPVFLRPHRDAQGNWHALVIFVDAHKWPENHQVQLVVNRTASPRLVSPALYEAMKNDNRLQPFP